MKADVSNYFLNLLILLDEALNTLAGGYPDETVSLTAARARNKGSKVGCVICKVLDSIVKNHCDNVILNEHKSIAERQL